MLSFSSFVLALAGGCLSSVTAQSLSAVTLKAGIVNGIKCPTADAVSFLAIPYAQSPTGNLRFAPPQPFSGPFSTGTLNATKRAPSCIQFGREFVESGPQSEDCLFVDIWVPANANAESKLPVKFWIYGGSDTAGGISDGLYDGCHLATDAIVVSANYRVGALGFLALETAGIEGNMGVKDLLLALQWVQDNISAFGGDSTKVLVFGQSAGAGLTWILSSLPQAKSLMNAAIAESGAGSNIQTNKQIQSIGATFADTLGCNHSDISCFRSASPKALNSSQTGKPSVSLIFSDDTLRPYVDGKTIPVDPVHTGSKVPFITGSNSLEGTLFIIASFPDPSKATAADYTTFLQSNFGPFTSQILQAYPLSAFNSTPFPPFFAISTIYTVASYTCQKRRALNATANAGIPAWVYYDTHTPSCPWTPGIAAAGPDALKLLGTTHTAEIPLVFGETTGLPNPSGNCSLTPAEVDMSRTLISAWTSMAESGTPDGAVGIEGGPWPAWDKSDPVLPRGLLIGNQTSVGVVNFTACELWDRVYDAVLVSQANGSTSSGMGSVSGSANGSGSGSSTTGSASGSAASSSSTGSAGTVRAGLGLLVGAVGWAVLVG